MDDEQWALALSLDEEIEWQLRRFAKGTDPLPAQGILRGRLPEPEGGFQGALQAQLNAALDQFRTKHPVECARVDTIGVSMIGLVDRPSGKLTNLARKNWGPEGSVIDFKAFLPALFPLIEQQFNKRPLDMNPPAINLHNDCTAKCLAEFRASRDEDDPPESILYAMFSEGVNAAFVHDDVPLFTELHTEMGHIFPTPHPRDKRFNERLTGCPIHVRCYEGLASEKRFWTEWGPDWKSYDDARELLAFYAAQMCYTGSLIFSPKRISLSINRLDDELLDMIRQWFELFNSGGSTRRYLRYEAMSDLSTFIQQARFPIEEARIEGAIELARLAKEKASTALRDSWHGYRRLRG